MSASDDPPAGSSQLQACPCKETKTKNIMIQCCNKQCKYVWWHATCAGYLKPKEKALNEVGGWHCPSCVMSKLEPAAPIEGKMLNGLSEKIEMIKNELIEINSQKISTRLKEVKEDLTKEIKTLTVKTNSYAEVVQKNLSECSETGVAISSINSQLKTVGTNITNQLEVEAEAKARESKACNVVIFNIPEASEENPESCLKEDVAKLKQVLSGKCDVKTEHVRTMYRIGLKSSVKPRPIILKLTDPDIKEELLKLRFLKYEEQSIFIQPDRTRKELEIHRKLVSELREKKTKDGDVWVIRNGKVVPKLPFRANPQVFWG